MMAFEWRRSRPIEEREERWAEGGGPPFLFASDLHLCRGREDVVETLVARVGALRPDAVLLGGDLVDRASGLALLEACLSRLTALAPVVVIPGNHDGLIGVTRVRALVIAAGAVWLPDHEGWRVEPGAPVIGHDPDRLPDGPHPVLLTHDPAVFPRAVAAGYSLVLAGHLHGSQCHWFQWGERSYPGGLFYRWNGERFQRGTSLLLVSRGMADTLPLRWNCRRDTILVRPGTIRSSRGGQS